MHFDENVRDWMLQDRSLVNSIPLRLGKYYGEPYTALILGSLFFIQGTAKDNIKNKKLGFEILQSSAYIITITGILKFSFGRARPSNGGNAFEFHPFSFQDDDYLSLSSGHTGLAFTLSTVLATNVEPLSLKILFYIPAFVTGFSRVYDNDHWTSDVFLGAFLGYFVGKFVTELHEENDKLVNAGQPGIPLIKFSFPL